MRPSTHDNINFGFRLGAAVWFVWLLSVIDVINTNDTDATLIRYLEGVSPLAVCALEAFCLYHLLCTAYPDPYIAIEAEKRVQRDMAVKRI